MTDVESTDRLERTVDRLRAQNRRYQELIQNLASALQVLREARRAEENPASVLQAFESFAADSRAISEAPLPDSRPARKEPRDPVPPGTVSAENLNPLQPNPGWKCLAVEQRQLRIGFTLFGMTAEEIEDAVNIVEQRQVRARDFIPVFVIDAPVFTPFRSRGYVVEYAAMAAPGVPQSRVLGARLEHIRAKWGLGDMVDLGQRPGSAST